MQSKVWPYSTLFMHLLLTTVVRFSTLYYIVGWLFLCLLFLAMALGCMYLCTTGLRSSRPQHRGATLCVNTFVSAYIAGA